MNSKSVKEGGKHNMYSKSKRFIASFLAVLMAVCMLPVDMFGAVGVVHAAGDIKAELTVDSETVTGTEIPYGKTGSLELSVEDDATASVYYLKSGEDGYGDVVAEASVTMDETETTEPAKGHKASAAITITEATTLKAFTIVEGTDTNAGTYTYAKVVTLEYTIAKPQVTAVPDGTTKHIFETETGEVTLAAVPSTAEVYYVLSTDENYATASASAQAIVDNAQKATAAIAISAATTIKAVAKAGDDLGDVQTFEYDVTAGTGDEVTVGTVSANPTQGAVTSGTTVALSYVKGDATAETADIYYTTTATTKPAAAELVSSGTQYTTTPISITAATTIYAVATTKDDENNDVYGDVATFAYTIDDGGSNPNPPAPGTKLNRRLDIGSLSDGDITEELTKNGFTIMPKLNVAAMSGSNI